MANREIVPWCYLDDAGRAYSLPVAKYLAEQVDDAGRPLIGGMPDTDGTARPLPRGLKPRNGTAYDPENRTRRRLIIYSRDAPLIMGADPWIQIRDANGVFHRCFFHLNRGEGRHAGIIVTENSIRWCYIDDLGRSYSRTAPRRAAEQTDADGHFLLGGRPESPTDFLPEMPASIKPRTVTVVSMETLKRRQLVVYSTDAPLWTGAIRSIELPERGQPSGRGQTYQVRGKAEELERGRPRRPKAAEPGRIPVASEEFDSAMESAFWETWQRTTKIRLTPQYAILGYRIDFVHLPTKTAIELDGYYYHAEPERFRKDRQRDRELSERGWNVVRFAGDEVVESVQRCVDEAIRLIRSRHSGAQDRDDPDVPSR